MMSEEGGGFPLDDELDELDFPRSDRLRQTSATTNVLSENLEDENSLGTSSIPSPPPPSSLTATAQQPQTKLSLATISQIMQEQQGKFTDQLNELHRLISVQKTLTGIDPLTNQPVPKKPTPTDKGVANSSVKKVEASIPADSKPKSTANSKSIKLEDKLLSSGILSQDGGVSSADHIPNFVKLMTKENTVDGQSLILTVLLSTKDSLSLNKFLESEGLSVLKDWLNTAKDYNKANQMKVLLKALAHLPMTFTVLKSSELGKLVSRLSKHTDADIAERASKLVASWKKLVHVSVTEQKTKDDIAKKRKTTEVPEAAKEKAPEPKKASIVEPVVEPKKPKLAPDHIKTKRSKTQFLEDPSVSTSSVIKAPLKTTYEAKPLSNDAIKKAKLKEKVLGKEKVASEPESPEAPSKKPRVAVSLPPLSSSTAARSTVAMSHSASPTGSVAPIIPLPQTVQPSASVEPVPKTSSAENVDVWSEPMVIEEFPPESLPGVSKKTGKPKKRVSWPSEDKLLHVKLFMKEVDIHVDEHNFALARQNELRKERELLINKKKQDELQQKEISMQPSVTWKKPPTMEIHPDFVIEKGTESKQKSIQAQRELTELAAFYLDEEKIPESPAEPIEKGEDYDDSKTPVIPFEEVALVPVNVNPQPVATPSFTSLPSNVTTFLTPDLVQILLNNPQLLATIPGVAPGPSIPITPAPSLGLNTAPTPAHIPRPIAAPPVNMGQFTQPQPHKAAPMQYYGQNNNNNNSNTIKQTPPQSNLQKDSNIKGPTPSNLRTKPCRNFTTPQGCKYGAKCTFSHDMATQQHSLNQTQQQQNKSQQYQGNQGNQYTNNQQPHQNFNANRPQHSLSVPQMQLPNLPSNNVPLMTGQPNQFQQMFQQFMTPQQYQQPVQFSNAQQDR